MRHQTVGEVIVETLQHAGVQNCYGIVGDTLNHITDAIRRSQIKWVHVRHEEVAAMAAGAESYMTGRLSACAGSCGPGSLHTINGLLEAHRNRSPVVMIATQVALSELGMEFPQEVDLAAIFKTCSHFCATLYTPAQARRLTAQAAQAAINLRGVAVLIVPGDLAGQPVPPGLPFSAHHPQPVCTPSDGELEQLAELLLSSERLTLYCGAGCADAHDEIVELARRLKAPVAHTSRAKDFIEPDNPFNVGMTGMLGIESGYHATQECDTLLLLGADFAWTSFYPHRATIVQVDNQPTHLGRRHPVKLGLVGDIRATLQKLLPRLSERHDDNFLQACQTLHQKSLHWLAGQEKPGHNGLIHPQYLVKLIDEAADEDAFLVGDSGTAMVWLLRHTTANGKRRTLASLLHGTMANAMPEALGIKNAFPQRQVIAICGDGGLSMLMGDLLTIVQEGLDIKIVILNNSALDFVEIEQKVEGLMNSFTDLHNPDWVKLAEAVGFKGLRVDHADQLPEAVAQWLAEPGPMLLDVKVNQYELIMPPTVTTEEVLHTALYSAKAILSGHGGEVVKLIESNFLQR